MDVFCSPVIVSEMQQIIYWIGRLFWTHCMDTKSFQNYAE